MNPIEYKQAQVDDIEAGVLKATLSKYGNVDDQGDIMLKGCYDDWLIENDGKPLPMLKGHDVSAWPIGSWVNIESDDEGLKAEGKLAIEDNPDAEIAAKLIKAGLVTGVSVGFRMLKGKHTTRLSGDYGRDISKVELMEASITPFRPANKEAIVDAIDGADVESIYKALDYAGIARTALLEWRLGRAAGQAVSETLRKRGWR